MTNCRIGRVTMKRPSNVVMLDVSTTLPVPPSRVLAGAMEKGLEDVIVMGWDSNKELYLASSMSSNPRILWLVEQAKKLVLME